MLPDWVSNPGPLTYELGALPIALRSPAHDKGKTDLWRMTPEAVYLQTYVKVIFSTGIPKH